MNSLVLLSMLLAAHPRPAPAAQPKAAVVTPAPAPAAEEPPPQIALDDALAVGEVTQPMIANLLQALARQLSLRGFAVISPPGGVPAGEPGKLAELAKAAGAGYAANLSIEPTATAYKVKLLVIDASDASVVAKSSASVSSAREAALVEALRKQVAGATDVVYRLVDARRQANRARPEASPKKPEVVEPAKKPEPPEPRKPEVVEASAKKPEPPEPKRPDDRGKKPGGRQSKPSSAQLEISNPSELLVQARKAYEAMEYDSAAALSTRALSLQGLEPEVRLDAYVIQASSLAITADPQSAEVPFRLLLRARPDFDLPKSTPPKILGVFQKVQAEEKAIGDQIRSVARKRLVDGLRLLDDPPARARGGRALPFSFRLRDPTAAVTAFEVPFRKQGEGGFSVLALRREADGTWRGALPAEWTANDRGVALEFYLSTRDDAGPLLTKGDPGHPLRLEIAAGTVERVKPLPRWSFWAGVGATGAMAIASGSLALATHSEQNSYTAYAKGGLTSAVDGAVLMSKAQTGHELSRASIGTAIAAGILAAATAAIFPFTKDAEEETR